MSTGFHVSWKRPKARPASQKSACDLLCGAEFATGLMEATALEMGFMPLVRFDVALPGHAQPLTFRLWKGERLAEAVSAFLAGAGADAATADGVALLRRAGAGQERAQRACASLPPPRTVSDVPCVTTRCRARGGECRAYAATPGALAPRSKLSEGRV